MRALVEGFTAESISLATRLTHDGTEVHLAGSGEPPAASIPLRDIGVLVEGNADLDKKSPDADVFYFDVWTPEVAPRVSRARAAGARVSCFAEYLLSRSKLRTIGVTGTAGKSSTTHLLAHLLRSAGTEVVASPAAVSGNLWPHPEHLALAESALESALLLVELTSSHLAFMSSSPEIAVVTCFWPDHIELHGSLARYREAKETIGRHQTPEDIVVTNALDDASVAFREASPARRVGFGLSEAPDAAAFTAGGELHLRGRSNEAVVPLPRGLPYEGRRRVNVVAACAAALAAGLEPDALLEGLRSPPSPSFRTHLLGHLHGVRIIDDGMAATPAKSLATMECLAPQSAVVVCGGNMFPAWGEVHASPEERPQLELACDEIMRVARSVVVFGSAAERLERLLAVRGVAATAVGSLEEAVETALDAARGLDTLVFSPMFPLSPSERARFSALVAL